MQFIDFNPKNKLNFYQTTLIAESTFFTKYVPEPKVWFLKLFFLKYTKDYNIKDTVKKWY